MKLRFEIIGLALVSIFFAGYVVIFQESSLSRNFLGQSGGPGGSLTQQGPQACPSPVYVCASGQYCSLYYQNINPLTGACVNNIPAIFQNKTKYTNRNVCEVY